MAIPVVISIISTAFRAALYAIRGYMPQRNIINHALSLSVTFSSNPL